MGMGIMKDGEWKGCLGSGYTVIDVNGYEGVGSGHVKHWIGTWVRWLKEWSCICLGENGSRDSSVG